jgi:hypothetical protein
VRSGENYSPEDSAFFGSPQFVHCSGESDQLRNSRNAARPPQKAFSQRGHGHNAIRLSRFTTVTIQIVDIIIMMLMGVKIFIVGKIGFRNMATVTQSSQAPARIIMLRRNLRKSCHF